MIPADRAPVIVDALRTPIGTAGGALREVDAARLAAPLLRRLLERTPQAVAELDEVCLGNVRGPGGNPARVASLLAGIDERVPALTVDRQCGSGVAAVEHGVGMLAGLRTGFQLVGGVQSVSTQPLTLWPGRDGGEPVAYTRAPFTDPAHGDPEMGVAADRLATERGITRERVDAYALRSHERAVAAQRAGVFTDELVLLAGLATDERPRPGFTAARLARFRPAFSPDGVHTAANCCGVNDGAAALLLADARTARRHGLGGLRVLDVATAGCDPSLPGLGIAAAVELLVRRTGIRLDAVDVLDCNEAFGGQVLACLDQLGLDERRNCPQGGAVALGHPWAASGAVQLVRLFSQLVRQQAGGNRPGRLGLAAIAIGGGQGTAVLVQTT